MKRPVIYAGSYGIDIYADVGDAIECKFRVIKPSGVEVYWECTRDENGLWYYRTKKGDLDESGFYRIEAVVKEDECSDEKFINFGGFNVSESELVIYNERKFNQRIW